jgi:transposase
MYSVLDKDTIENKIVTHLPEQKRGFPPRVPLSEIISAILYKLKTGIQWALLPVKSLFSSTILSWQSVYYHFRKFSKRGIWKDCWTKLILTKKVFLDLSSCDLDGSHTPAIKGGEAVGYQGRKKRKTTNALYLTDRQGLPLAMSVPEAGNHHDLFEIKTHFGEILASLESANISVDGLFINADSGFDSKELRSICEQNSIKPNFAQNKRNANEDDDLYFDELLYKERYAIERTNAWLDGFRSLLNRFDTTIASWESMNYIAFMVIALRKFKKRKV